MTCAEFRKPFGLHQGVGLLGVRAFGIGKSLFGLLGAGFYEAFYRFFFGFGLECFGAVGSKLCGGQGHIGNVACVRAWSSLTCTEGSGSKFGILELRVPLRL